MRSCLCFTRWSSIQLWKPSSANSSLQSVCSHILMTSVRSPLTQNGLARSTRPCRTSCDCIPACVQMVARRKFGMPLDRSQACVTRWIRWREASIWRRKSGGTLIMWRLNWRRFWRNNTSSCSGSRASRPPVGVASVASLCQSAGQLSIAPVASRPSLEECSGARSSVAMLLRLVGHCTWAVRSHCGHQFHVAAESRWSGVAQRSAHQRASQLGQLGGHFAHDPPATSCRGGGDGLMAEPSS